MLAIGNEELENKDAIGDRIYCDKCCVSHAIKYSEEVMEDGTRKPSKLLGFYNCGGEVYLATIKGKVI